MSPRTRKQTEQLREDRRRAIREASVTLFARNGFDGTSTAEVARMAGVSQATVFVYYPTKEELFRAAVLEPLAPSMELVRGILGAPGSPRERVEQLARLMLASYAREEAYLALVQYVTRLRDRFPEAAAGLMEFTTAVSALLGTVIEEGQAAGQFAAGDARHYALFFTALINGLGLLHPAPPDDPLWNDAVTAVMRMLEGGAHA